MSSEITLQNNVKYKLLLDNLNSHTYNFVNTDENTTSLVVQWSELLATNHEVPGLIPGSTMGIFLVGEDPCGDHGLGSQQNQI